MEPITPAKPKAPKMKPKPTKPVPKSPDPSTFAFRQIEASPNKRSAAVLFTPYQRRGPDDSIEPQPSPTGELAAQFSSADLTDADAEEGLEEELQQLTFESSHGSQSHSSSDSEPCSAPSGPHARFYTKPKEAKPRGGAKDVCVRASTITQALCEEAND